MSDLTKARHWIARMRAEVQHWEDPARGYVLSPQEAKTGDIEEVGSLFPSMVPPDLLALAEYYGMAKRAVEVIGIRDLMGSIADQNDGSPQSRSDYAYKIPASLLKEFALRMVQINERKPRDRTLEGSEKSGNLRRAVLEPQGPLNQFLEEVELDRIKRCHREKCRKFFWAGRIDRPCCSEVCRNAYKQKNHREREKRNRPYKKRLQKRITFK